MAQADVAELVVDVVEPQLVGEGHVEHHGLKQLLVARALGEHPEAAHHFEPVCNLDDHRARVGGILDYQALVVLGLEPRVLRLYRRNPVETLGQFKHVRRECADIDIPVDSRGLVKVYGGDARLRQAYLVLDDFRHVVGMLDERDPVVACLVLERREGHLPRLCYKIVHGIKYNSFFTSIELKFLY